MILNFVLSSFVALTGSHVVVYVILGVANQGGANGEKSDGLTAPRRRIFDDASWINDSQKHSLD